MYNKKYSREEISNYYQGFNTGREDYLWCKGNKDKINECIKSFQGSKNLGIKRKDKNTVSFANGYLAYFNKKLGK